MVLRRLWFFALLTGFALYGLAHAPQADAQYPGGGNNYPGAGWHPLIPPVAPSTTGTPGNDPLNDPYVYYSYDWTKINDINVDGSRDKYNEGAEGSLPQVGTPGTTAYTINSPASKSTIKFGWVPPNGPAGAPDPGDFPVPSLFVLGSITPSASLTLLTNGTDNPIGFGVVDDGWGWGPHYVSLPAGQYPSSVSDGVHRKILPAVVESATVQSITMAPSGSIMLSLASPTYGQTMGTATGFVGVPMYAYPISLTGPNPLTNPKLGDGSNQFVYDAQQPDGFLTVPASANAPGAATADTGWALPHVGLFVSPAMQPGALQFQWTSFGQQMYVYTPGSYPSPDGTSPGVSYPSAAFIYQGLPPDNTGFGNHTMTMKVDNAASQTANYQLFFSATVNNYPGALQYNYQGALSYTGIPNWYYYNNLLSNATGSYGPGTSSSTSNDTNIFGVRTATTTIRDDAYGASGFRVFGLNKNVSPYVIYLGTLYDNGTHNFIETNAHEQGHQTAWLTSGIETDKTYTGPDGQQHTYVDLISTWKSAHCFQSVDTRNNPVYDTTGAYSSTPSGGGPPDPGDVECIADIQALQPLLAGLAHWQDDWSNVGLQINQPYFYQNGAANFYWKFSPNTYTTVHLAPIGQADTSGHYHITTLQSLQNLYPGTTILTSLSQLGP